MEQPLVSIAVITYNSSSTVTETLDSILNQTYPNLELIISDDCSTDNTVALCKKWIFDNQSRFRKTVLIESPNNTGISANCNRAEDACSGEWEKLIAGDDVMLPKCIETYMQYVAGRTDLPCLFSRVQCISAIDGSIVTDFAPFDYSFFSLSREEQLYKLIYKSNCIPAPAVFINLFLMRKLGIRNDERIPFLEDYPKWINILNAGYKLEFLDKELVKYRVFNGVSTTTSSLSFSKTNTLFKILYLYPEWEKRNSADALIRLNQHLDQIYGQYFKSIETINKLLSSDEYRIGKMIKKRFRLTSSLILNIGNYRKEQKTIK